ncbi:hypothetical protein RBWH47_01813 [Rhodopirellula baltica WH47]|uniref:Uncharacterized protein n=1 Tax=Rhodopirellula baltica WH47 TaxID=991778 RepID=F2AT79_RHOBT|nr:hypothetical protein RBWH47_01813 [Rhodopirellula baltica WH47]
MATPQQHEVLIAAAGHAGVVYVAIIEKCQVTWLHVTHRKTEAYNGRFLRRRFQPKKTTPELREIVPRPSRVTNQGRCAEGLA